MESPRPKRMHGCISLPLALATFGLYALALLALIGIAEYFYTYPYRAAIYKYAHPGLTRADVERHLATPYHEWDLDPASDRAGSWWPARPGEYSATSGAEYSCPDCNFMCRVIVHYNERNIVERAYVITFD